jgi:hypothetical protein
VGLFKAGGVDDRKAQVDEACLAWATVAGDTRGVVDERQLLSNQTVEKRRLADIRATDDGDRKAH